MFIRRIQKYAPICVYITFIVGKSQSKIMLKKGKKYMKVAFHNLGCKVNSYETYAMEQQMKEKGYEIVPFSEGADIYIVNTCTVTNIADRKSRQMLHKAKKMNENAIVVAVGCYVQAAGDKLKEDMAIDLLIGNNNKSKLVDIIEEYIENKKENLIINDLNKPCDYEDMSMTTVTEHTRAFIKIQDGCNQFCTYCIIPYARGRIRSRKLDDIVNELTALVCQGYKEIVLTGIHLSSYGKDFKNEDIQLIDVIEEISQIKGIERIRLGSLEPQIITEEFMERVSKINSFCPHFHLSLQSGCDTVLRRMNRRYDTEKYYAGCELIRKYYPLAAITTDVIVGFPGETENEAEVTKTFLEKVSFAEMHIFKYSMRQGTKAAAMDNQVDEAVKSQRSDELLKLNDELRKEYISKFIGKTEEVLFEEQIGINDKKYYVGYTKEYVRVAVTSEADLSNNLIKVNMKELLNNEILLAEIEKIY